jgi:hypothetical protein
MMSRHPRAPTLRYRVDPGDVPPEKVARRLHLTLVQFDERKARLFARGFPPPDPDTGMYDLEAVDRWRRLRNRALFPELTGASVPTEAAPVRPSMGDRFVAPSKRSRNG